MEKRCKKCQRILPEGYKYKLCENCRNKQAQTIKNTGKAVLGAVLVIGGTAITFLTNGKINPKGKA